MRLIDIFKITTPILFAYIPLGIAFGVFAVSFGISWQVATFLSSVIYAGSAEFLVVAFIVFGAGLFEVFVTIFFVNFRHFFYSISMLNDFKNLKGLAKKYSIFALTDETFALFKLINIKNEDKQKAYTIIALLSQIYWVFGVFLGSFFGTYLDFNSEGLDFILTALFVVLAIEIYKKTRQKNILFISIILGLFGLFITKEYMLITTLLLASFYIIIFKNRIKIDKY